MLCKKIFILETPYEKIAHKLLTIYQIQEIINHRKPKFAIVGNLTNNELKTENYYENFHTIKVVYLQSRKND